MIRVFYNGNGISEPFAVQNGLLAAPSVTIPTQEDEICACAGLECERNLQVFGDINDSNERKNDKTSFLYKLMSASDTAVLKLLKDGVEIETLNNNNFGEFFDIGSLSYGIPEQDFYTGYIVDWREVLIAHGVGSYTVAADITVFGASLTYESEIYKLYKYSDEEADGSVRLISYQNGNIESSNFNFTGMNWYQQIRINGILWNKQAEYITDSYFTSNRTITQIQDSIEYSYDLQVEFVIDSVSNFIIENNLLANEIYINDYNLTNTSYYNMIPLAVKEITSNTELYYYNGRSHVVQFTDRIQNHRKRNYN